jgi:hypothetical protein
MSILRRYTVEAALPDGNAKQVVPALNPRRAFMKAEKIAAELPVGSAIWITEAFRGLGYSVRPMYLQKRGPGRFSDARERGEGLPFAAAAQKFVRKENPPRTAAALRWLNRRAAQVRL